MDGPYSSGIQNGVGVSGYTVCLYDELDLEIGVPEFSDYSAAWDKIKELEKSGVIVSVLTGG